MITLKIRKLDYWWEKSVGLLGKSKPENIIFLTRFGIHTFGMKFPIDVLILDAENKVVSIKDSMKPNQIFFWSPKYNKVVELPAGMIQKHKIKKKTPLMFTY